MLENLLIKFDTTEHARRNGSSSIDDKPKPFIQWVGGKREMMEQYKQFLPKAFSRYFEPFLGGGALFFNLLPAKPILSDNNLELISTYEAVRDRTQDVINLLRKLKSKHSKELFIEIRNIDRKHNLYKDLNKAEIAARFIYLNQTCFNGLYRVNKNGQFNVPIGSSLNRLICDEYTLLNASKVLDNAQLECADFEIVLAKARKDDFVYLDPPYHPIAKYSDFNRYTKEKFFGKDQIRLKETFDNLTKRGVKAMLSNSTADLIKDLYIDYNIHEVLSGRNLNSKKELRGKVTELLITNY